MAMLFSYRGFRIEVTVGCYETGETYYGYQINGNGLSLPIVTNERLDDAETALDLAKGFIHEHLEAHHGQSI